MVSKKGMSEVIGYVLLILIAIALSGIVFVFMQKSVPKDVEECPEGVSFIISDYYCANGDLTIILSNRGLYTITGFKIKAEPDETLLPTKNMEFIWGGNITTEPGKKLNASIITNGIVECKTGNNLSISILPFVMKEGGYGVVYCDRALVNQRIKLK